MAVTEAADIKKVNANGTDQYADFGRIVNIVYIKTTGDAYFAFDRAATTNDFLITPTDNVVRFDVQCTQVHVISSGTPTVYIMGVRQ
jgi:hypothetical protein